MKHSSKDVCNFVKHKPRPIKSIEGERGDPGDGSIIPFSQTVASVPGIGFVNSLTMNEAPFIMTRNGILTNLTASLNIPLGYSATFYISVSELREGIYYPLLTVSGSIEDDFSGILDLGINKTMVPISEGMALEVKHDGFSENENIGVMGSFTII